MATLPFRGEHVHTLVAGLPPHRGGCPGHRLSTELQPPTGVTLGDIHPYPPPHAAGVRHSSAHPQRYLPPQPDGLRVVISKKGLRSQVVNRTSYIARRFRSTLPRFAEWCAANGEKKGEMGGGEERAVDGTFSLAAHLPPVPYGRPHHSAANAASKRNLLPAFHTYPINYPSPSAANMSTPSWRAFPAPDCQNIKIQENRLPFTFFLSLPFLFCNHFFMKK